MKKLLPYGIRKTGRSLISIQISITEKSRKFDIKPGETITVFELNRGGRIAGIELSPAISFEGLTKNMDIKITWDDEKIPAVYCPVADFFGYAFGRTSMQSLLLGSRDNINYCYFPMPFDKSAKIELVYRKIASSGTVPIASFSARLVFNRSKKWLKRKGSFMRNGIKI